MTGISLSRPVWHGVGFVGFLVSGILFVAAGALSAATDRPPGLLDVHMTVALAFLGVGVGGLYAVEKSSLARLGQWSAPVLAAGVALVAAGTAATYVALPLGPAAVPGLLFASLGGLLLGAATVRRGSLPGWSGLLLAVGFPAPAVVGVAFPGVTGGGWAGSGGYAAALVPGVCWLGVAGALWTSIPDRHGT